MKNKENKRSVVLGSGMTRRTTSVNISKETWEKLKSFACDCHLTLRALIEIIDADRRTKEAPVNLSEALRQFVSDQAAQKAFAA